jgi:hypothetical protein
LTQRWSFRKPVLTELFTDSGNIRPIFGLVPKPRAASTPYGDVPNDLDLIARAKSGEEVLDLLNQVLAVLRRTRRMAELPAELRMDRLTDLKEVRIALRRLQGDLPFTGSVQWDSDALCVFRSVYTVADRRLRELKRRE